MELAEYKKYLKPKFRTILKLNISWQEYFPACSSSPWQIDGLLNVLQRDQFKDVTAVENMTVVTDARTGVYKNKHMNVLKKYDIPYKILLDLDWEELKPSKALVFGREDWLLPSLLRDSQIVHLPTLKTHGHSTITISMKNAFGFLKTVRHHYHLKIHEILVDLLRVQKEYCKSLFAIADGTIAMDGGGPRTGKPCIKNYILASGDMVAIDAVGTKMIGYNPWDIGHIKLAHEEGLGIGDLDQIQLVGDDISDVNFCFRAKKDPVIYFDRLFRGSIFEPLVFRTELFNVPRLISHYLRDIWLKTIGQRRINEIMKTGWGKLFKSY